MVELVFLMVLFIGIAIATYRDIKTREVPDMVSYGLIVVGVLGGLVASLLTSSLLPFLDHLIGFAAGFLLGCLMYYTRQWGGGDAKLLMGVGAMLGLSWTNISLIAFVLLLIFCGAIYGLCVVLYLALVKHRKEFAAAFKLYIRSPRVHRIRLVLVITATIGVIALFFVPLQIRILLGFILVALYLLIYSWILTRVVERSVMIKIYPVKKLTEGDWLAEDVVVRKKVLVSKGTTGLTLKEIALLKKNKITLVKVREGIPFVPGFMLAFIVLLLIEQSIGSLQLLSMFGL